MTSNLTLTFTDTLRKAPNDWCILGKYDGVQSTLTYATSSNRIVFQTVDLAGRKKKSSTDYGELRSKDRLTGLNAARLVPGSGRDVLVMATFRGLLIFDVHAGRDVMSVSTKVNALTVGYFEAISTMLVVVAGDSSIQDGQNELVTASEDKELQYLTMNECFAKIHRADVVKFVTPLRDNLYGFASSQKFGVFDQERLIWEIDIRDQITSLVGGTVQSRNCTSGILAWTERFDHGVVTLLRFDDATKRGEGLLILLNNGDVRGYCPQEAQLESNLLKVTTENEILDELHTEKQELLRKLRQFHFTKKPAETPSESHDILVVDETQSTQIERAKPVEKKTTTNYSSSSTSDDSANIQLKTSNTSTLRTSDSQQPVVSGVAPRSPREQHTKFNRIPVYASVGSKSNIRGPTESVISPKTVHLQQRSTGGSMSSTTVPFIHPVEESDRIRRPSGSEEGANHASRRHELVDSGSKQHTETTEQDETASEAIVAETPEPKYMRRLPALSLPQRQHSSVQPAPIEHDHAATIEMVNKAFMSYNTEDPPTRAPMTELIASESVHPSKRTTHLPELGRHVDRWEQGVAADQADVAKDSVGNLPGQGREGEWPLDEHSVRQASAGFNIEEPAGEDDMPQTGPRDTASKGDGASILVDEERAIYDTLKGELESEKGAENPGAATREEEESSNEVAPDPIVNEEEARQEELLRQPIPEAGQEEGAEQEEEQGGVKAIPLLEEKKLSEVLEPRESLPEKPSKPSILPDDLVECKLIADYHPQEQERSGCYVLISTNDPVLVISEVAQYLESADGLRRDVKKTPIEPMGRTYRSALDSTQDGTMELHLRILISSTSSTSARQYVNKRVFAVPEFALYKRVPYVATPPTSSVTFSVDGGESRIKDWIQKAFMSDDSLKQSQSDFAAVSLQNHQNLVIKCSGNQQVTINTDDIQLAAKLITSLTAYLRTSDLEVSADFPILSAHIAEAISQLDDTNNAIARFQDGLVEAVVQIQLFLDQAEDNRLMGDM
ncbi:Bardet-Biedl syndrome 2 protein [Rhizophlyctis rosea]|nr:Bardet-Biedl syndrome 2 protein [Rhizophlyctis rosea]